MNSDTTPTFLGVAALAVALWFLMKNGEMKDQLVQCHAEFQSFKEGVVYGR